ncbi:MAG: ABC transporter permease [Deltaproteobacteria bacterium RBG_16_48_10]|nr:MAG: ABC transporter permease [Deltaproteobacteria bacterium RBG_16_48_10]
MWERVYHILLKEFLQVLRDPRMKAVIFVTPIIQLLVFGYAVTTDVKNIATAVYDLDRTPQSRELLSRFFASGYFRPQEYVSQVTRILELMDKSTVSAAIQVNKGFAAKLAAHEKAAIQMIVDGTDSNTATVVMSYAAKIIKHYNEDLIAEAIGLPQGVLPGKGIDLKSRAWFNINLESRMFYVPGVVALIGMLITLMLTSMAVVREREIGTLEQLMVTPMRPVELILGKTLPFALIGFFDVALITAVAVLWFKVPIEGSLLLLFFATGLFLMSTLGTGLFISTISSTQQQAMMSTFFFYFPAVLLSGFMFPIANMPVVVQWITYLNPLRYFLVIIRGLFLKGVGAEILWPQMIALGVLGSFVLTLSSIRFSKRLE